jgi:serine/threonine protein kinase
MVDKKEIPHEVAVKILNSTTTDMKPFIQETNAWALLKHPHLANLIGVCFTQNDKPRLVSELVKQGCLLDYLKVHSNQAFRPFKPKSLLLWSKQIADAMRFLHRKKVIHRDLACRNVLIEDVNCVKVADFGLAKIVSDTVRETRFDLRRNSKIKEMVKDVIGKGDSGEKSQKTPDKKPKVSKKSKNSSSNSESNTLAYDIEGNEKLPIKWLSPEIWETRVYTDKSDVWAFGVTIWEIFTYGQNPYAELNGEIMDLPNIIRKGVRLQKPRGCLQPFYELAMLACWQIEPKARPDFERLFLSLEKCFNESDKYVRKH